VLEVATRHEVKAFVFSSSATVYGEPDQNPIPETALRQPATSPYGNTKQICEDILRDATLAHDGSLRSIALRYFNPIGAHPSGYIGELPLGTPNNLIPYLTQAVAGLRPPLTVYGNDYPTPDGTCIRDYIHVVDLAEAHIAALEYLFAATADMPRYDVYNVGTGHGTSVQELIDTFEKVNSIPVPYSIGARRAGDVVSCYADPTKIENTLHWRAQKSLDQALQDAWNWQKNIL
ncbi:MAG: UDP-glucose 4-epimerase GalE, partial [Candidatus Moraniibacteriota bacterium]